MKLETMSYNVVAIMRELVKNDTLVNLIYHETKDPYNEAFLTDQQKMDLIKPNSPSSKILPYAFNPEAVTEDGVFIRVYYNDVDFNDNEVIAKSQLHIDVICANSLWLIYNNYTKREIIRPYDIVGRIVDLVGKRSGNSIVRVDFTGLQHLYINNKFNCIRMYANYTSVEA